MKDLLHMSRFEKRLFMGAEWPVNVPLWVVVQLNRGIAYLHSRQMNNEMPLGALAVIPPNSPVTIIGSVLDEAELRGYCIKVNSLSGLLTLAERICLEKDAVQECSPFRQVEISHSLSEKLGDCFQNGKGVNLAVRLGFLQSFAEWLSPILEKATTGKTRGTEQNPKERLRQFINQIPESEMTELSLTDIARSLCCCERHASRLFHEVCGCSFRKYISELRLDKACQMLVQGNCKIIDVALESGHSSLALFNYNFKNRFRLTPTEWRERHVTNDARPAKTNGASALAMAVLLLAGWLALFPGTRPALAHSGDLHWGKCSEALHSEQTGTAFAAGNEVEMRRRNSA
jgi:AraC-like DNA-binding protein